MISKKFSLLALSLGLGGCMTFSQKQNDSEEALRIHPVNFDLSNADYTGYNSLTFWILNSEENAQGALKAQNALNAGDPLDLALFDLDSSVIAAKGAVLSFIVATSKEADGTYKVVFKSPDLDDIRNDRSNVKMIPHEALVFDNHQHLVENLGWEIFTFFDITEFEMLKALVDREKSGMNFKDALDAVQPQ